MKTTMLVFALALAPALLAQDARDPGRPALQLRLSARYDGPKILAALDHPAEMEFVGILVASPWDQTLEVPGLPRMLSQIAVLGFGVTENGHLGFKAPADPRMDLNIQGAALVRGSLQVTEIQTLRANNGVPPAGVIHRVAPNSDARVAPVLEK